MPGSFDGKVVLVTGAAMGLGAAFATAFAAEGAAVGLLDPDETELDATVARITEAGGRGVPIVGDVSKTEAAERAVDTLVSGFGGLDVLVNNAGVVRYGELAAFPEEDWDFVLDINLKGMYQTARFAIPEANPATPMAFSRTESLAASGPFTNFGVQE